MATPRPQPAILAGMATEKSMGRWLTVRLPLWLTHWLAGCAISWIAGSLDRVCAYVASCVAGCVSGSADWVLGGHGYGRTSGVLTAWGKKGTRIDQNHEFVNRLVHLNGSLKSKARLDKRAKDRHAR